MNSLVQKLEGTIDAVEKKNIKTAINKVESFQNEVQAQSRKKEKLNFPQTYPADLIKFAVGKGIVSLD